jgi:endonuclease-3
MGSSTRNSTPKRRPAPNGARDPQVSAERVASLSAALAALWPDAVVELDHGNAYQLLVATILSAQSTDKMINTVTPALFARYADPPALARADQEELERMIFSTGFYRAKARNLIAMAQRVVERHRGVIPDTMEGLVDLPGVARKTANVVLGSVFGKNEGVVVDTHVARLAARLGLTAQTDPLKIEQDLTRVVPRDQWSIFAHRLIWHGRRVCHARKPDCEHCTLAPLCPSAFVASAAPTKPAGKPPVSRIASTGPAGKAPASRIASTKPAGKPPVSRTAPTKPAGKPPVSTAPTKPAGKPPVSRAAPTVRAAAGRSAAVPSVAGRSAAGRLAAERAARGTQKSKPSRRAERRV